MAGNYSFQDCFRGCAKASGATDGGLFEPHVGNKVVDLGSCQETAESVPDTHHASPAWPVLAIYRALGALIPCCVMVTNRCDRWAVAQQQQQSAVAATVACGATQPDLGFLDQ
jgi:hypothetical protein